MDILRIQDEFQPKMLAMFVAGTPPDTHVLDMPKVQAYAKRDVILPLTPMIKEDKAFKKAGAFEPRPFCAPCATRARGQCLVPD